MSLIYREESGRLRGCSFDVQNAVGLGKREKGYQNGCQLWLEGQGVPFRAHPPHHIRLRGKIVHTLRPDLVAWDKITVELKAERRKLINADFVQLFDYLKFRKDRLGLLVNFGLERVEVQRIPYEQPKYELLEDWSYWSGGISGKDRELGAQIWDALRFIFDAHGSGYCEEIVRKLILFELRERGLRYAEAPIAKSFYRDVLVDEAALDCITVEDTILLIFSALLDDNGINTGRGRSYLESLGLEWGVAANFGKTAVEVAGLRRGV